MGKMKSIFVMIGAILLVAGCNSPLEPQLKAGDSQGSRAVVGYSSLQAMANGLYVSVSGDSTPLAANASSAGETQSFTIVANTDGTVSFLAKATGLYATVETGQPYNPLIAKSAAIGTAQKFQAIPQSNGTVAYKSLINGLYVCTEIGMGSILCADKANASTWEQYKVSAEETPVPLPVPAHYSSLKAEANNRYVTAAGSQILVADADAVGASQSFGIVDNDDGTVSFIAKANGLALTVDTADGNALKATAASIGRSEKFTAITRPNGSKAYLSAINGHYVCADLGQGGKLYANRGAASTWESFVVTVVETGPTPVDFGPNTLIFDPSMSAVEIQSQLDAVFAIQESNQFGSERYALLFKPGNYDVHANIGFYTSIAGLGQDPDDVYIQQNVVIDAGWFGGNATCNFWRSAENLKALYIRWASAQAAPFRRMHVMTELALDSSAYGWNSGGYIADSKVEGQVGTWAGQQWFTRNSQIVSWYGINWNGVFSGVEGAPAQSFPNPPYTTLATTPVVREKPYLYVTDSGDYAVFVPALATNTRGVTWANGSTPGTSLPIDRFFIAKPTDSAAAINAALASGKNLIFTPGIYRINQTIEINRADTVVLGLGYATLIPENGVIPMTVADVGGVKIAGILFDAGLPNSPVLLRFGPAGSSANHASNPSTIQDVFFRIGGAGEGAATTSLEVNQNDLIIDHTWIWRADHGAGAGWTTNPAKNGLVVNGNRVTALGLFVEHYQEYNVLWNGQDGKTIFFQNELPYDPPSAAAWGHDGIVGYAAYKVADTVTTHEAWGMGSYCVFVDDPSIVAERSFEAPLRPGVKFHDLVTVSLGKGQIAHVINDVGDITPTSVSPINVVSYP